jgi:exopolysaccharide production protein ExoZ
MDQALQAGAPASTSGTIIPATRLHGLQYLRAIAATMVAIFHTAPQIPAYESYLQCPRLAGGVDVFFVISGLIMAVTAQRLSAREFIVRRLMRIVPLYWLLTTLLVVVVLLAPQLFHSTVLTPASYVQSLLFVPFRNPDHHGDWMPLLVPGWTLNYEMFFYGIFALVLWLGRERLALLTGLVLGSLVAAGLAYPGFYTSPMLLEFWLGILMARTCRNVRLPVPACMALIVAGFAALMSTDLVPARAIAAAAIVLGALVWERSGTLPLVRTGVALGDASYSIYLTHIFSLGLARTLWLAVLHDSGHRLGAFTFALLSTVAVLLAALACYRWIEAPITAALHRHWATATPASSAVRPPATA